jgi:hypothetical protein
VLARARVLAAVVARSTLEQEVEDGSYTRKENEQIRRNLLRWISESGLKPELEPHEHEFLKSAVGRTTDREAINASWRSEGLGVLIWALGRFEMPAYDESCVEGIPADRIGFLAPVAEADLASAPRLRTTAEISRYSSHMTIVGWRLKQFRASRDSELYQHASEARPGQTGIHESMDFAGYLRGHACFKEHWLDGLRFVDGDLAIGQQSIADSPSEAVKACASSITERQIAVYWLEGDDECYSRVSPDTFLSAC